LNKNTEQQNSNSFQLAYPFHTNVYQQNHQYNQNHHLPHQQNQSYNGYQHQQYLQQHANSLLQQYSNLDYQNQYQQQQYNQINTTATNQFAHFNELQKFIKNEIFNGTSSTVAPSDQSQSNKNTTKDVTVTQSQPIYQQTPSNSCLVSQT
jgi:hypothetical protein